MGMQTKSTDTNKLKKTSPVPKLTDSTRDYFNTKEVVDSWEELFDDCKTSRNIDINPVPDGGSDKTKSASLLPEPVTKGKKKTDKQSSLEQLQSATSEQKGKSKKNKKSKTDGNSLLLDKFVNLANWKSFSDINLGVSENKSENTDRSRTKAILVPTTKVSVSSTNPTLIKTELKNVKPSKTSDIRVECKKSLARPSVIKKVVDNKTIHIIWHDEGQKSYVVVTDELVKLYTRFSKRNSAVKALESKQAANPFYDIHRKHLPQLFKDLESFSVEGIVKRGELMPEKLNVTPLNQVPNLLQTLNASQLVVDSFTSIIANEDLITAEC